MKWQVTVLRTERITFELEAADKDDAERRYLMDGDETDSETTSTSIEEVTRTGDCSDGYPVWYGNKEAA